MARTIYRKFDLPLKPLKQGIAYKVPYVDKKTKVCVELRDHNGRRHTLCFYKDTHDIKMYKEFGDLL